MCTTCYTIQANNVVVNKYDPTRTTMLRSAFKRDSNRRFTKLAKAVREAVQYKDVFGLTMQNNINTPNKRAWGHMSDTEKINAFLTWVNDIYVETILAIPSVYSLFNTTWTDKYAKDAYKRGVQLAQSELKKLKMNIPTESLDVIIARKQHKQTLESLLAYTYSGYKTIAASMDSHFARIISQGFIEKITPKQMADRLIAIIIGSVAGSSDVVNIIGKFVNGKVRGQSHVETVVTKTHHLASIQEYENWDLTQVSVQAEFTSMKDGQVCSICATLDGQIYTISEIKTIIPVHVRCRCFARPIKT